MSSTWRLLVVAVLATACGAAPPTSRVSSGAANCDQTAVPGPATQGKAVPPGSERPVSQSSRSDGRGPMTADEAGKAARAMIDGQRAEPKTAAVEVAESAYSQERERVGLGKNPAVAESRCVFTVKVAAPVAGLGDTAPDYPYPATRSFVVIFDKLSGEQLEMVASP